MPLSEQTSESGFKTLTICNIKEEIKGVKTFSFSGPVTETINYKPGQYLTFILPNHHPEIRRSYSIVATPVLKEDLAIGVKRVENGAFSRWFIDQAKIGDQVLTTGASGFFTLPENLQDFKQLFFLAAGSGITPILSLIKTILFGNSGISVVLIYSNKSPETSIYHHELEELAEKFPERFTLEFLYSNAANLARARLYKDLLRFFIKEFAIVPTNQLLAYICGPENYMRMCTYGLEQSGFLNENIRKENFSTHKVALKIEPPDTDPHLVTVKLNAQETQFTSQFPLTILQSAKKFGLNLPYSCEAGKCGSCAMLCTKGQVWMAYNEVLTDREINKGLVLTCTGFAIKGNITLEMLRATSEQ